MIAILDALLVRLLRAITRPDRAGLTFVAIALVFYAGVPIALGFTDTYSTQFVTIVASGGAAFAAGWMLKLRALRLVTVELSTFLALIWIPFVLFTLVAWSSASQIPLVLALSRGDALDISTSRELFLKARVGWQSSFVYINAMLTGALIPYTIALMFFYKIKRRWWFFAFFLVYCLSFMEKAFFFRAAIPLTYLIAQNRIALPKPFKLIHFVAVAGGLLFTITLVSGLGGQTDDTPMSADFFSTQYGLHGTLQAILWRSVAVPVVTGIDSIRTFYQTFGGRQFGGATSSLFAAILHLRHVEFERAVYASQWGGQNPTGTGSANAIFVVEAFINWGLTGVLVFGFVAGVSLRFLVLSREEPLRALWPLYCFGLFTAGFIGLMLSNGFILLFLFSTIALVLPPSPEATGIREAPEGVIALQPAATARRNGR